jgi:hypothetical protein
MKTIFNGTPHSIKVISPISCEFSSQLRKFISNNPVITEEISSNGVLSAKIDTVEGESINNIPVFSKSISGCDPIPKGYDVIIVSTLYVSAAREMGWQTTKLYTVADPVYSEDGTKILGSKGICPAF